MWRRIKAFAFALILLSVLGSTQGENLGDSFNSLLHGDITDTSNLPTSSTLQELPDFDGTNFITTINNNVPNFSQQDLDLSQGNWQIFSDLDGLNRVGVANTLISSESFPTNDREPLYVNPSGWHQKKVSNGKYLYDRCHMIGYQLTGENNNPKNLFTGTTTLNRQYMVEYENKIADYLKTTGNHVRYRVTPLFKNNETVCRGVQLEARSIENEELSFNVFIYNVDSNFTINYLNGESTKI